MVPSEGGRERGERERERERAYVCGVGGEKREYRKRGKEDRGEIYKITTEVLNTLLRYVAELKMENW